MTSNYTCLACGVELDTAFDTNSSDRTGIPPDDGLIFTAAGNYGSTIYDPGIGGEWLEIVICDGCVALAASLKRVLRGREATRSGPKRKVNYEFWSAAEED